MTNPESKFLEAIKQSRLDNDNVHDEQIQSARACSEIAKEQMKEFAEWVGDSAKCGYSFQPKLHRGVKFIMETGQHEIKTTSELIELYLNQTK